MKSSVALEEIASISHSGNFEKKRSRERRPINSVIFPSYFTSEEKKLIGSHIPYIIAHTALTDSKTKQKERFYPAGITIEPVLIDAYGSLVSTNLPEDVVHNWFGAVQLGDISKVAQHTADRRDYFMPTGAIGPELGMHVTLNYTGKRPNINNEIVHQLSTMEKLPGMESLPTPGWSTPLSIFAKNTQGVYGQIKDTQYFIEPKRV